MDGDFGHIGCQQLRCGCQERCDLLGEWLWRVECCEWWVEWSRNGEVCADVG